MQKLKCILSYDGTNFYGFQIQPEKRTVQGEIEKALKVIHKGKDIRIQGSGRTDRGVHALGQTIQFETEFNIPEINWQRALNALLPTDINVTHVKKVSSQFHARYGAVEREYRYFILHQKEADVFKKNYYYQFPYPLQIDKIQEACTYLEGKHDFTTFTSANATVKGSKVRTLSRVTCEKVGNEIEFVFRGDGFLYNMVRIMVGCLLDIGQGVWEPSDIPGLFRQKDRAILGETAPSEGLYLWKVTY